MTSKYNNIHDLSTAVERIERLIGLIDGTPEPKPYTTKWGPVRRAPLEDRELLSGALATSNGDTFRRVCLELHAFRRMFGNIEDLQRPVEKADEGEGNYDKDARIFELEAALANVRSDRNKVIDINKSLVTQRDRNHAELSRAQTALEVTRFDKEINDKALRESREEILVLKADLIDAKNKLLRSQKDLNHFGTWVMRWMTANGWAQKYPEIFNKAVEHSS